MEQTKHYNGKHTLVFDPQWHTYLLDGKKVDGVTTALSVLAKPALIWWAAKKAGEYIEAELKPGMALDEIQIRQLAKEAIYAHKNSKEKAADLGSYIHEWIDKYVKGQNPAQPINPQMKKATSSFIKWYDSQDIKDAEGEKKLCSPTLKLAGTVDFVGLIDGKLTIVDWKTGSGIYPEMFLQMGAYSLMFKEEFGRQPEQLAIVNCSAKAPFKVRFTAEVEQMENLYIKVLEVYKLTKQLEEDFKNENQTR